MKNTFFFFFFLLALQSSAQKAYFQQESNYVINVRLDDKKHTLQGEIDIEYVNHSPEALKEIYMHLWGNAFKNQNSEFARQLLRNGSTKYYFSENKDRGYYKNLSFHVNGDSVKVEIEKKNPDIAKLILEKPLPSGGKIHITTPFLLKIPASFSRLGHVGESYQMTQWFPKPAVYDASGWHPIPYLNQGEFYSEFGSFDVSITLPENYVVGATGELQNESEKIFLAKRVSETEAQVKKGFEKSLDFPASSEKTKTLHYKAANVHDFAWFADKRFWVLKEDAKLASGKTIDSWVMFTNLQADYWSKAVSYVTRSVQFYSEHLGEYPYPHATAVQSALSAGAGMEYPMITVIGEESSETSLDQVITHEVGHNWFYGILASNERDYPWMDEGLNSYYENRYMERYYGASANQDKVPKFISGGKPLDAMNLGYLLMARQGNDQPCEMHSNDYKALNYGVMVYGKTAKITTYLEKYLGTENFDKAMKSYYAQWKFKHPQPSDFRNVIEKESNKNLAWYFDDLLGSTKKEDYALKNYTLQGENYNVTVQNKGEIASPFNLTATKNEKIVATQWYEGNKNTANVTFPKGDYDKIILDGSHVMTEFKRNNNVTNRFPSFKAVALLEGDEKPKLGILPVIGWNKYDKAMLGATIYTPLGPGGGHEGYVMPMYGLGSKKFNFLLDQKWNFLPNSKNIKRLTLGVNSRKFSYDVYDWKDKGIYVEPSTYLKGQLSAEIEFKNPTPTNNRTKFLNYRIVGIHATQYYKTDTLPENAPTAFRDTQFVHELKYTLNDANALNPYTWTLTGQGNSGFAKIFTHFNQKIRLSRKREAVYLHAFVGAFAYNKTQQSQYGFLLNGRNGYDYLLDELQFGRSVTKVEDGFSAHQLFNKDAGLKTLSPQVNSQTWMMGGGLAYNLPFNLPFSLRPYLDAAVYPEGGSGSKLQSAVSLGLGLIMIPDVAEIYFPIWDSSTIGKGTYYYAERPKYLQRVTFLLNLKKMNPYTLLKTIKLG